MKVKKDGTSISAVDNITLFKHCSGGFTTIHEKEYKELEQLLFNHGVGILHLIKENEDGQEE